MRKKLSENAVSPSCPFLWSNHPALFKVYLFLTSIPPTGYKPHAKGHFHGDQASALSRSDFALIENLSATRQSFVITDPRLPDNPIVYASGAFLELVGYTRDQVVGRNCRFLQGIDTDPKSLEPIRKAIETGGDGAACILNYKSDGRPFWNNFFIAALRDRKNQIVNYVSTTTAQWLVTQPHFP